jgi:hypothetical protein
VPLPAHLVHDLGQRGPVLPLQHGDHLGRLAALARPGGLLRFRGLRLSDTGLRDGEGNMKALITRLRRLESRFGATIAAMQTPCPSPAPLIAAMLARWGIVRDANESLIETFARAIGLTPLQLREELMRRAGLDRR